MIRSILETSLRFRALVVGVAVVVIAIGIARIDHINVDVLPEVMPVTVNVQTEALGLSAAEVEQLITVPIEADLLAGTPWVDVMRSESVPGLSSIELTFKAGTNPMHARQVVQERLTQAHALPNVSKPPQMLQPLSATNRVMMIGLSSKTQSLIETSVLARWTIRPRLMGVPGVANVSIWGQRERQLQVLVDPERLEEHDVSLIQVVKTAGNALWYSPLSFLESSVAGTGGFIETPNQRLGVRHVLPITRAQELAKIPVEGSNTTLDQVAAVVEDHQPLIGDATNGAGSGLLLVVEKLPGVNTLEVTDEVMDALAALKPGLGGIEFDPTIYQPARYIRTSIDNVATALVVSLVLVAVALLALSYSWRAALIGLVAMPASLLAALLVLEVSGAGVNAMVLAGLVLALGIIIDDSIVDIDQIRQRLRRGTGKSTARTIVEAAFEIRGPMMSGTAIAVLAAVPVLFMVGVQGAFVQPMATAYVLAVLASLVVALTLTPALCLLFMRRTPLGRRESPLAAWLRRHGESTSSRLLAAPRTAFAVAVGVTLVALGLAPRLAVTTAPTFKERDLLVQWDAAPGTSIVEMDRILKRVSDELRTVPGVRNVGAHAGRASLSDQIVNVSSSEVWVSLDPNTDYEATVAAVEAVVQGYPGIDCDVMTYLKSRFGEAISGVDEPIVVRLYGQEMNVLQGEAAKVKQSLEDIPGIAEPRIEVESEEPIVEIEVDLKEAEKYGVKPGDVRRAAATLLAGIHVGDLFEEQKVFEVVVWGAPRIRHSVARIRELLIDTPGGGHVPLGDVASVRIAPAPEVIRRENVARRLDVVADVRDRNVDAVAADVRSRLGGMQFPLEYRAELLGEFAAQQAARNRVIGASIAVAVGSLLILQASFGCWSLAFAVLLTLPMALAGGVIAAVAGGLTLSLGSLAGFVTVLCIAVRQALLLVEHYRSLRFFQGQEFTPALVRRGLLDRTPAILGTAIVTGLALLPFALFAARPGHEIVGPMTLVILGGLVTSTLYALGVVPWLYERFGAEARPDEVDAEDLQSTRQLAV